MFAIIFLANTEIMREFFFSGDQLSLAREGLAAGKYAATAPIAIEGLSGEEAAEEMFDLTNNPSRQEERVQKYGRGRSVSTGDIVCVGGEMFVCMSCGWQKL